MSKISDLKSILDNDDPDSLILQHRISDESSTQVPDLPQQGYCIECKDQEAVLYCEGCLEDFCQVCFSIIHRNGKRKLHSTKELKPLDTPNQPQPKEKKPEASIETEELDQPPPSLIEASDVSFEKMSSMIQNGNEDAFGDWITERAKYIPLRLTTKERKYMRLLEATMNVSEYTDKIDVLVYSNKTKRIVSQIQEICAILSGLLLASDYKAGQALFEDRQFDENKVIYQRIFEIGRRYKLMNPHKMRNTYGKLMYMLQASFIDSVDPDVQQMLGFNMVVPIRTVYDVLEYYGAQHVLQDKHVAIATQEIIPDGKPRSLVQTEIKQKEYAIEYLSRIYSTNECPPELIRQCLYSIGDNHAFLRFNRDPCDKMIKFLTLDFVPTSQETDQLSLSITSGRDGSRLSHSHEKQYYYALQTLTLWREILHEMYMLWHHSDSDLLSKKNYYRLKDTGQGLNRVQPSPTVSRAVHSILNKTQKKTKHWVGSSVVHLGDHNVPNALMFIDKYNQVALILNPIVSCIEYINEINNSTKSTLSRNSSLEESDVDFKTDESSSEPTNAEISDNGTQSSSSKSRLQSMFSMKLPLNPFDILSSSSEKRSKSNSNRNVKKSKIDNAAIRAYIDYAFGGPAQLRKIILSDFFRSAFDGSGADNFYDAGSCIDGRLTSAWNWCSQIEKKEYFPVFLLSGFVGFNGENDGFN
ncbi:hypothetical protein BB558_004312 [Smittium angustum]|uniref:B box-type domain-containing protein n=1 Tax=Smittium angustum TaxID=133377 RepID=A0A2U1J3L3_SMIAN|nr:hypothetical protein BB558_004312 [Smittium angustum]